MTSRISHPNWTFALALLSRVLPGSTGFEPGQLQGARPMKWSPIDLEGEPAAVNNEIVDYCHGRVEGLLVVVATASYSSNAGPFFVRRDKLQSFLDDEYPNAYGEIVYCTDVVILSPAAGVVVVVHHGGLIAAIDGVPASPFEAIE